MGAIIVWIGENARKIAAWAVFSAALAALLFAIFSSSAWSTVSDSFGSAGRFVLECVTYVPNALADFNADFLDEQRESDLAWLQFLFRLTSIGDLVVLFEVVITNIMISVSLFVVFLGAVPWLIAAQWTYTKAKLLAQAIGLNLHGGV